MFGTVQRVPGRSPEITRLRGSGNMELRFKLTVTIVYGPVSSVCFWCKGRYICYQLSSWREAWLTQSRKASSCTSIVDWSCFPTEPSQRLPGAIEDGFRYPLYSLDQWAPSSERAFYQAKKLITGERNQLDGETVTTCECQKQWQGIGLVGDASMRGETDGLKEQAEQHETRLFDDATSDDA